jgi:O-antigen ligase
VLNPVVLPSVMVIFVVAAVVASRPEYGLAVVLALVPFTNLRVAGAGTSKPMHLIVPALVFGLLVYSTLLRREERVGSTPAWVPAAVVLFVAVALAAALQAISPHDSVKKLFLVIAAAALFFAVLDLGRTHAQLTVVAVGAVTGLLLASLQGIEQHLIGQHGVAGFVVNGRYVARSQGSFGHPNDYGGYLAFLMPLAAAMLLTRAFSARVRWLGAVALAAAVPALAFSYARGAIAALVIGSVLWLAVLRPRYALGAAILAVLAAVFFAPPALRERFNTQAASSDVPVRTDIWGAAIDVYTAHPLLGVGLDNFSTAYAQLPSTLANASQRRLLNQSGLLVPPHAQNLYLNVLAEEGIVGIAALAVVLLGALVLFFRASGAADARARAIGLGCGAGLLTLCLHSILDVTLFSELAFPFFALIALNARLVALDSAAVESAPA